MKVLIFLATYNEAQNISLVLNEVLRNSGNADIFVVDDNSPDGTAEHIRKMQSKPGNRIHLVVRPGKLGLASAYLLGFEYAIKNKYDRIVTLDADHSHDPSVIPELVEAGRKNDLVLGSRYIDGGEIVNWGFIRLMISRSGNIFARNVAGLPFGDCTSGYRCYDTAFIKKINALALRSEGYAFLIEILYHFFYSGAKIREVPITFTDRIYGKSKISQRIIGEAFFLVLRLFFKRTR